MLWCLKGGGDIGKSNGCIRYCITGMIRYYLFQLCKEDEEVGDAVEKVKKPV